LPAAQEFGLPLLPPSKAKNASFAHGANFAITGATALDTPYFEAKGLGAVIWNSGALMTQIQWFRDLKPFFCNTTEGEIPTFSSLAEPLVMHYMLENWEITGKTYYN